MNINKNYLHFPTPMNICNVTNLFKNKSANKSFDSYRGIFPTPVFQNIFDKLVYNDEYKGIDETLTF